MKNFIIWLVIIIILAGGGYLAFKNFSGNAVVENTRTEEQNTATTTEEQYKEETSIGKSVEGRDITAYHYGTGDKEILFVGGIHGGYEWNTSLLAYQLVDYLKQNSGAIPANLKVTVIPVLNPDGLNETAGTAGRFSASDVPSALSETVPGRFNGNDVDLNRNFDCDWQPEAMWQSKTVSGGSAVFSEPESQAIKNYIETNKPASVVVYYSAAGGVFASSCHDGVLGETNAITKVYADASGYPAYQEFDFYEITGDMVNWLAKIKVPAISVLLTNHTSTEWTKNQKGVDALLEYYSAQ